jgi:hypothetical protein
MSKGQIIAVIAAVVCLIGVGLVGAATMVAGGKSANKIQATKDASGMFNEKFKQNLKLYYSTFDWYSLVTSANASPNALDIHTNIYPDGEGKQIAKTICTSLASSYLTPVSLDGFQFQNITIYAGNGDPFEWTTPDSPC